MAQYNADILLNLKYNERSLERVAATVGRVQSLAKQIKPINLLRPGAGAGADQIAMAMDKILDRARAINKEGASQISATYAGAAQTADAFAEVLRNVNITAKNGNVELANQSQQVKELAGAYAQAAAKAEILEGRFTALISSARQRQGLSVGPVTTLGTLEADIARASYAAETRTQNQILKNTRTDLLFQRLRLDILQKQSEELLKQDGILSRLAKKTAAAGGAGKFGESLALGAGFPLLFGGGAGSVAGSIIGSFFGTGFGGQILGGALGQALDQAVVKIQNIGNAIKTLNFDVLTESGIRLSSEIQTQLDLLLKVGDALTAQQIVSQEIARETGTLSGVTEDVANSVNILGDSWRKVVNAVSTTLGIIASPLAVALAGVLELVNAIFRGVNTIFSLIGKGIKTVAEFVINLVGGEGAVNAINDGIARLNSGLSEANAKAAEFRNTLNQAVVRTSIELQAAQRLTPGITFDDKLTNIRVQAQKELNLLAQDEADARVKIREENAKASEEIVKGLLAQNKAAFDNRRQLIEINTQRQISTETQRQQLDQERKATQELERQRKELERIAKLRVEQLDAARRNYLLAESEIDILTSMDPISKKQAEYDKIRVERMFTFTDLLQKALSDEERVLITERQFVEILIAELKQEEDILTIQKQQTAELYAQLGATALLNEETQKRIRRGAGAGSPAQERGLAGAAAIGFDPNVSFLLAEGLAAEVNAVRAELDTLLDPINQVTTAAKGIGEAFSQSFTGIVSGTMTAQEALANFFQNVADQFLDMAAQMIAKWIQLTILNSVLKLFPTGPATGAAASGGFTLPTGAGYAQGFSLPPLIPGMAKGGSVSGGMPYIVGEKGPELFVPGKSGTIVPNDKLDGGSSNIVVNVDAKGSTVQGDDPKASQLGNALAAAVQAELIKQKKPGGLLYS